MKRNRVIAMLLAFALVVAFPGFATAATADPVTFTDVGEDHPYHSAIEYCAAKGFVKGVGGGRFEPDAQLTRAQFAAAWARSMQFSDTNHTFSDVGRLTQYFDTSIVVLYAKGIVNGVSDTRFAPNEGISREQMALMTMRTYELGVADSDDYKFYNDHAAVSDWARNGISSCLNNGLFNGLFTGPDLEPQRTVTRGELCKMIYNINQPAHAITIDPAITGGTVTASRTTARVGVTVYLAVEPDEGMRLKPGTLLVNEQAIFGGSFVMPDADVIVTAEFEEKPVVQSISVTTQPTNGAIFTVGDTLEFPGMVVTATYPGDETRDVTDECVFDPALGTTLVLAETFNTTIRYTEGDVTVETTISVTVNAAPDVSPEPSDGGAE